MVSAEQSHIIRCDHSCIVSNDFVLKKTNSFSVVTKNRPIWMGAAVFSLSSTLGSTMLRLTLLAEDKVVKCDQIWRFWTTLATEFLGKNQYFSATSTLLWA